jgi:hypothetical protein
VILGWAMLVLGVPALAFSLPFVYMLVTGQVKPGELCCMGEHAPTLEEATTEVIVFAVIVAVGFVLQDVASKVYAKKPK